MLVAEVLGQLGIQRGLKDVLRELAEQAARPCQSHALLLRLREQAFCEFLLIDDLPGHGINHLVVNNDSGRVSHGHLLSDQAGPSHTIIQTVPNWDYLDERFEPVEVRGVSREQRETFREGD